EPEAVGEALLEALAERDLADAALREVERERRDLAVERRIEPDGAHRRREALVASLGGVERRHHAEASVAEDGRVHRELVDERVGRVTEPERRYDLVARSVTRADHAVHLADALHAL